MSVSPSTRFSTPAARPASARPHTAASNRPQTAVSSRPEGSYVIALFEGRGIAREVGMAALDRDTGRVIVVQVVNPGRHSSKQSCLNSDSLALRLPNIRQNYAPDEPSLSIPHSRSGHLFLSRRHFSRNCGEESHRVVPLNGVYPR
jgi:hypothetical protein